MSDIYISGEIYRGADEYFAEQLNAAKEPITIHINSGGGDPFTAIAISHAIRHNDKNILIRVEGICASAATLIICCGKKVSSAFNSLFMIHSPSVMLNDAYNKDELEKVKTSLEKVEGIIKKTLETRLGEVDLSKEQWLDAEEALKAGLIDEITPESVEMQVDNKQRLMFVNGCFFNFKNMPEVKNMDVNKLRRQIRAEELTRIRALNNLKGNNMQANAIIDVAIEKGQTVNDVRDYVEAVTKYQPINSLYCMIDDQKNSGVEGVIGSSSAQDFKELQINNIANMANNMS